MVGAEPLTCALTVADSPSSICRIEGGHNTCVCRCVCVWQERETEDYPRCSEFEDDRHPSRVACGCAQMLMQNVSTKKESRVYHNGWRHKTLTRNSVFDFEDAADMT
jgi:hypothetical protein